MLQALLHVGLHVDLQVVLREVLHIVLASGTTTRVQTQELVPGELT